MAWQKIQNCETQHNLTMNLLDTLVQTLKMSSFFPVNVAILSLVSPHPSLVEPKRPKCTLIYVIRYLIVWEINIQKGQTGPRRHLA